ncbi:hypothetical protein [Roseovarius ramblicola]|uniref:Mor transcription activator family protein n=1 Tax=Roseovarius ramblicola TaxID=2022336 RepID=A0ABV5HYP8_9RHOB
MAQRNSGKFPDYEEYPQSVRELAEVIGLDQALHLCRSLPRCGSRPWRVAVYVPKRMPLDHKLVAILGYRDAMRLARHFGGEVLQPSNGRFLEKRWFRRNVWQLRGQGMSAAEIAEDTDRSIEAVKGVLRGKPPKGTGSDDR